MKAYHGWFSVLCGCISVGLIYWNVILNINKSQAALDKHDTTRRDELNTRSLPNLTQTLPMCLPPSLKERAKLLPINQTAPSWEDLAASHAELSAGGRWRPRGCRPLSRVAIVVPYRDRDFNLRVFLQHMHPFLQKQQLDYGIFVAEPLWDGVDRASGFSRGLMKNIGFLESMMKSDDYDCVIFNDVDLLPENLNNTYKCPEKAARHMCIAVDYYKYHPLAANAIFGGVVNFRKEHFLKANGYSNLFFGWGAEDTDLLYRCYHHKVRVERLDGATGRYKGTPHTKHKRGKFIDRLYRQGKYRWDEDDGLKDIEYSIVKRENRQLYAWILADYSDELYKRRTLDYFKKADDARREEKAKAKKGRT